MTNAEAQNNGITMLDINKNGEISERVTGVGQEDWLDNTLLGAMYPGIKLALVTVPTEILEYAEGAAVSDRLASIEHKGTKYRMVGASGSAKDGKFYFCDALHAPALAERFQRWPEAAITYFGILTSNCKVVIEEQDAWVMVVPDHELGTNDCRYWIRRSLFNKMNLPAGHIYQARLAFGETQAKGLFKIMEDDVADALGVDIIVPESSIKPAMKLPPWLMTTMGLASRVTRGPIVLGVREVSRNLRFESSYTVLQNAPEEVIFTEIVPPARKMIAELTEAWHEGNHRKVVEMIGKRIPEFGEQEDTHDEQFQTIEAVLLADGSGEMTRHPYVQNAIKRLIARWAYKLCTGGGLDLPAFTLADDGYLFLREGKVVSGSDWLPRDCAIVTSLESERGLCVRYPVRMAEDLLPMKHVNASKVAEMLVQLQGFSPEAAAWVAETQLCLEGSYSLHSETAKRNGGDFDGDMICVINGDRYPKFVEWRFQLKEHESVEKTKASKLRSPWYNLEFVALKTLGNQIGVITNLMSSALANGREDLVYVLVPELQKEIDGLKHNTRADRSILKGVRDQLQTPEWLGYGKVKSLNELPEDLKETLPSDRIGHCYVALRKDIKEMVGDVMSVGQFAGLLVGHTPTQEMFNECRTMIQVFAAGHGIIREAFEHERKAYEAAQAKLNAAIKAKDELEVGKLRKEVSKARASLRLAEEKNKHSSSNLHKVVAAWGMGKTAVRKAWCQALHTLVCKTKSEKSTGSIAFHAFPQEMVEAIADRTNGIRTTVAPKQVRGAVVVEGNSLYMLGGGKTYLFSYDEKARAIRK
jgi:hypothetical protein